MGTKTVFKRKPTHSELVIEKAEQIHLALIVHYGSTSMVDDAFNLAEKFVCKAEEYEEEHLPE
jgi:hypothetical protein